MTKHTFFSFLDRVPVRRTAVLVALAIALAVALVGVIVVVHESATVQTPRVVMISLADLSAPNLQLVDLDSGTVTLLTQAEYGVDDYAVSPTGAQIAFTQNNGDGTSDIWLVDVASGDVRALTACVDALCAQPAWNPDESEIIFQRKDRLPQSEQRLSEPRTWIVNVRTLDTHLLFADPQVVGGDPLWSPDGNRIAVYDPRAGGIRVHDLVADTEILIGVTTEATGAFSPDGSRLIYPVLVRGLMGLQFYTHLEIVDFAAEERVRVSAVDGRTDDAAVEDSIASWSPDGATLAVARRYLDERYTAGKQIYLLDLASGEAAPLVVDAQYTHAAPQWDAAGQRIVYQRFDLSDPAAEPEIWVYELATGRATRIAENGFFPAWVP